MFPENPLSRKIDAMLREFRDVKEISLTLKASRHQVLGRVARCGYRREYITADEKKQLLAARRKTFNLP